MDTDASDALLTVRRPSGNQAVRGSAALRLVFSVNRCVDSPWINLAHCRFLMQPDPKGSQPNPATKGVEAINSDSQDPNANEAELKRRRLVALRSQLQRGTLAPEAQARIVAEATELQRSYFAEAAARAEAAQLREREREHRPAYGRGYKPAHDFDPGAPPRSHEREGQRPLAKAGVEVVEAASLPIRRVHKRKRHRAWKVPRRKPSSSMSERVLRFAEDRAWSKERRQRLATRSKKNDAIIAHPSSAEAALRGLSEWARAAVKRTLLGEGWTLADECARRYVAWWCFSEEMAIPRKWSRPRNVAAVSGMTKFRGLAKFAMCVVGWTQNAIAITMSGAAYSCAGADPIDPKTVQRHTALAVKYGGVHVVTRNPDAPDHLRGAPTEANPRGWSINEYWLPAPHMAPKPGFFAATNVVSFGPDGTPTDLAEMLALELQPRRKWRQRKLLELQQAAEPPPL